MAFDLHPVLEGSVLTILAVNLVSVMPSTPGYIGVYDLASVAALGVLGISTTDAVAFAVTSHFVLLCMFVILGVFALVFTGLGWSALRVRGKESGDG